MSEGEWLDRLAERCGIVSAYRDIWGRTQTVSRETKRALLAAMGVAVGSPDDLRRELNAQECEPWCRALPPVRVVRETSEPIELPITLPEERLDERFVLEFEAEDGRRFELPFVPRELVEDERREIDGRLRVRCLLPLVGDPGLGYHRVRLQGAGLSDAAQLIVAPARCWVPEGLSGDGRTWGPSAQLYALRSGSDWGVGDFGDLDQLVRTCGELGAGLVGVNPLHALFPANPAHASPYSPSSRALLHWVYLDVEAVPDFAECAELRERVAAPEFQARLVALREGELVDWPGVAAAKREVLETLWRHFWRTHLEPGSPRGRAFRAFVEDGGPRLASYGVFEALEERFRPEGAWGWPVWPEEYRRPDSTAVARFAEDYPERVGFFQWLQWECERQLGAAGRTCLDLGLQIGLYQDLAVSVDRAGFEAWAWQNVFALDAGIGAPPDDFNLKGQNWGLPPWIPERLRESGYRPFVECLRANMRHAGALRIDHVMGLMRAFWIPPGKPASEGAYVLYPFEDLLGVLALESVRNRCLVVGEDLGTVPDEVREALRPLGVLSYRLFYFARGEDGDFLPPEELPRQSLVAPTTHDLPTLGGWWRGRDIALRAELDLFPEERQREDQLGERSRDRMQLLFALRREGLLEAGAEMDLAQFPDELTPELTIAMHRYLARGPSMLMTFQLEDVLGQLEQVNLPGTSTEHPNWCRRLTADLETLASDTRLIDLAAALRRERGAGAAAHGRRGERSGPPTRGVRIPRATYRLQLHRDFPFARATELVPYLAHLGISHVYASPFLQARPGSLHGYDIIDHGSVNAELGGSEGLDRLVEELERHEMGLVLDVVPNHMGVGSDNGWWMSVLEHGPAAPHAAFFDIDWRPQKRALHGRVLLPLLEDHYGRVLERGLLRLEFHPDRGAFEVAYHEHRFPVDPASYPTVLTHDPERLRARLGEHDPRLLELHSLVDAFANLPGREEQDPERVTARLRDADVQRRRLARLAAECEEVASFIEANVARFCGRLDDPSSHDLLDTLLDAQVYRLAFWRTAADEINYRRFFDINDLAGLRQEHPGVFEATHGLVLDRVRRGQVDGLRIDHPDGLNDPAGYYRRLAEELGGAAAGPGATESGGAPPVWTVVEKILAPHESLPDDWVVHGTTGYDFCNLVGGLFVETESGRAHDRIYHRVVGRRVDYDELLYDSKRLILETALASELTVLTDGLDRVSESDRRTRDFTRGHLRRALAEVIACFPVYRTYVSEGLVTSTDRRHVDWAVARARGRNRAADTSVYDFIRDVLVLDALEGRAGDARRAVVRFAQKFQQTTSPATAKGLEDTTFYIYNRLLALNEVGGEPRRFGLSPQVFHRETAERTARWPQSMLCTSTHDSKRSEDARARIAVLSEIPERWEQAVRRFSALNRPHKRIVGRRPAPSRNDEYALYQTLLGVWPVGPLDADGFAVLRERVGGWALKAVREAKVESSWIEPNEAYEQAMAEFIDAILAEPGRPFVEELLPLARFVARVGSVHSLSQVLLKLTVPGVPDIYQGQELIEPTLVDPDNRRPVDFARRRALLDGLERSAGDDEASRTAALAAELTRDGLDDGRAKLWLTWRTLALRRRMPELFRDGAYRPLEVGGARADRVVAFARELGDERVVVVAPRLVASFSDPAAGRLPVGEAWQDTWVAATGEWYNLLGGETAGGDRIPVAAALSHFPAALLTKRRQV